jgi:ferric-dicitrate binding protein FerR (iron transport regulator)
MSYSETDIAHLLLKKLSGELKPEEALVLQEWRAHSPENAQFYEEVLQSAGLQSRLQAFEEAAIQAAGVQAPQVTATKSVAGGRIRFLPRSWMRYAAILLLLAGTGAYLLMEQRKPKREMAAVTPQAEVAAAGYKATLTLSDGTTIALDSNFNGTIAQQGNASVVQTPGGEIRYELKGVPQDKVMMNTMRTPKGGQFRLTLPDGTKAWLNAASSITYPAVFVAGARNIRVSGEVYLEVAQDKSQPFTVDVDGAGKVEVLGTEFNINAYKDYGTIKTTLVNGKIRVAANSATAAAGVSGSQAAPGAVLLSPGQQAVQEVRNTGITTGAASSLQIVDGVDLPQVLAWKNGVFDFTGADFKALMREVERWYDVDVKYEGAIPEIRFKGKMDRAVQLSGVIRFLNDYGIHAQLKERTLTIKSK